ncbi:diguanylate cyclase [Saccharobesus litoralis]|uniref:Diguanylate cyclase n=1 Tax=Saccharobesus litoralis TaxID=2172099 RepID=A0A2S0VXF2_9ALTE|nr:transporter substrate-binding domain-containing protein [Saccharobesus litoralis]AWB68878.1 diguanylate cyclase [Saccharobesus litoralis]
MFRLNFDFKLVILIITILLNLKLNAKDIELSINNASSANDVYQYELLKMALARSNKSYRLQQRENKLNEAQLVHFVTNNQLDVIWVATNQAYEEKMLPIRVPLFKGLIGHRLFIIRQGEQSQFSHINTLNDLQQLKLGQGAMWADTKVLKSAGLNVVTTLKYENLFYMLDGGRFDMYPRGVHEPFEEVKRYAELPLVVEKDLLLVYPLAVYFFVSNDNRQLAKEIETGLNAMIEDGTFDQYFYNYPMVHNALKLAKLGSRKKIFINNANMSSKTPFNDERLWLDLKFIP